MSTSNVVVTGNIVIGKILSFLGYTLSIPSMLLIIVALFTDFDEPGDAMIVITVFIFFLALGVFMIMRGHSIKSRIKRFRKYVSLISLENINDFDTLASSIFKTPDFVIADLEKMIDKRFFINAAIDRKNRRILIGNMMETENISTQNIPTNHQNVSSIQCKSCGATNQKESQESTCDYCGSLLS